MSELYFTICAYVGMITLGLMLGELVVGVYTTIPKLSKLIKQLKNNTTIKLKQLITPEQTKE